MAIRRPELTVPEQRTILARKVVELVDAVNALDSANAALPDLGPGAGVYGSDSAVVQSISLDDKGRTLAVGTTARGSTVGSIFSMTGPGGATAPVVAYDFTQYDPAASVAANLVAANLSGTSALDLVQAGSGQISYQSFTNVPSQAPYGWTPFACSSEGGALTMVTGGSDYATTSGSPAALRLLGAMTAEWLGYITRTPTGNNILFDFSGDTGGGTSETEANNILYRLVYVVADNQWEYFHEAGAGVDSAVGWYVDNGGEADTVSKTNPVMFTLTRNGSNGNVALYINGRAVGVPDDGSTSDFPTGGTTGNLRIGVGGTDAGLLTLGFRLFNVELTAAQVRTSYQRTFFGVSS